MSLADVKRFLERCSDGEFWEGLVLILGIRLVVG